MEINSNNENMQNVRFDRKMSRQLDVLVDQIVKGNVVPVIGPGLTKTSDGRSIMDVLLDDISDECNMLNPAQSFSELIPQYNITHGIGDDIYSCVSEKLLHDDNYKKITEPSETLLKLLQIKYFPFVIYTSFDPTVEKAMEYVHRKKIQPLSFYNVPDKNDDICDNNDPTLYYFFGKVNDENLKFVLSEEDMLEFSRSWLSECDNSGGLKPPKLSHYLAKKFLLVIGCDYADWLFRFFWFEMKDNRRISQAGGVEGSQEGFLALNDNYDKDLLAFLRRSKTLTQIINAPGFIDVLVDRIKLKQEEMMNSNKLPDFNSPQENVDVFISYSHSDSDIVEQLYGLFKETGLSVWYDKYELGLGGHFMKEIKNAVKSARCFVPVLTDNITKEYSKPHYYREEWDYAFQKYKTLGNYPYIFPLCSKGFNLEDTKTDVCEAFRKVTVEWFSNESEDNCRKDLADFVEKIAEIIKNLKGND